MDKEVKKARINCYVSQDIRDYIDQECQYYGGIGVGAYISMVIRRQQEQQQGLKAMQQMDQLYKAIEDLKNSK